MAGTRLACISSRQGLQSPAGRLRRAPCQLIFPCLYPDRVSGNLADTYRKAFALLATVTTCLPRKRCALHRCLADPRGSITRGSLNPESAVSRLGQPPRIGDVNRITLENRGEAYGHRKGWAAPALEPKPGPTAAELAALKQTMADDHPDKGGSSEEFIKARQRDVAARMAAMGK